MARAFIASVPLAVALVAAVAVPTVLTPSTLGFDRWPADHAPGIPDRPVRVAPERSPEAPVRAWRPAASTARLVASAPVVAAPPQPAATRVSTSTPTGPRGIETPARQPHADPPRGGRPAEPAPVDAPSPAPQAVPQGPTQSATDEPAPTVVATVDVLALRAAFSAPVTTGSCGRDDVEQPAPSR